MVGAKFICGGPETFPLASANSLWTELAELENWLAIEFILLRNHLRIDCFGVVLDVFVPVDKK